MSQIGWADFIESYWEERTSSTSGASLGTILGLLELELSVAGETGSERGMKSSHGLPVRGLSLSDSPNMQRTGRKGEKNGRVRTGNEKGKERR